MFESIQLESRRGAPSPAVRIGGVLDPRGSAVEQALDVIWGQCWGRSAPQWVDRDWYGMWAREDVVLCLGLQLGPELVAALAGAGASDGVFVICPVDHSPEASPGCPVPGQAPGWPCVCQVAIASAWEAAAGWAAAMAGGALVGASGSSPVRVPATSSAPGISDPCLEDVAISLRISPDSARCRLANARALCEQPKLRSLVCSGAISGWAARAVLSETGNLDDEAGSHVIDEVIRVIQGRFDRGRRPLTSGEVRRAARRARAALPNADQEPARERALGGRRVCLRPEPDGMAQLCALIPELEAARIMGRLTALAQGLDDPERSLDQKRADLFIDALLARPSSPPCEAESETGPVTAPEIRVVVDLATLLGLSDSPGLVPGLGHIPASVARDLAADGRWRAWITQAAVAGDKAPVVAVGTATYTPSPALAGLVRAREPVCRMPGCRRRSERCDLDHTRPWPRGSTSAENLGPLCRRHHLLKTHFGWELENHEPSPGAGPLGWDWTTPAGITRPDEPEEPAS